MPDHADGFSFPVSLSEAPSDVAHDCRMLGLEHVASSERRCFMPAAAGVPLHRSSGEKVDVAWIKMRDATHGRAA